MTGWWPEVLNEAFPWQITGFNIEEFVNSSVATLYHS